MPPSSHLTIRVTRGWARFAATNTSAESLVGTQRTTIPQRVSEIRIDSVLKLDRAVKHEFNDDGHEEVPR